jgi:PAS domain S-box-containing protein
VASESLDFDGREEFGVGLSPLRCSVVGSWEVFGRLHDSGGFIPLCGLCRSMSTRADADGGAFWSGVDDEVALDRYRTLVNTIGDGLYQLDAEGRFVAVNDVIVETVGYDRDELLGEHVSLVLADHDVDRIEREIANQLDAEDGDIPHFELGVETADGGSVPCELRINPLLEDGRFQGTIGVARDISEEKQRLETLEVAQASYRSITNVLDEAEIGVFVLDERLEIAWADETIQRYFGLDRDDLIGRDKGQVLTETVAERVVEPENFTERVLASSDDTSDVERFECRVEAGVDREERWLEHYSKPIEAGQYEGGRVELYYDITDRKQSEAARREAEERFRSLVDAVENYAIARLDPGGHVVSWNEGATAITGYESEEILGEHISQFYTEADRAAGVPERNLDKATERGSFEADGWRVRKDGSRFRANVSITGIRDGDGSHCGYLQVTRDTTEQRDQERRLTEQAERLERQRDELAAELDHVFERMDDAFYALDDEFKFNYANERAMEHFGESEAELVGRNFWDVTDIDDDGPLAETFERAMATQESTSFERYADTPGIWTLVRVYPSRTGLSVYFRDITERKQREQELVRYETLFEESEDVNVIVEPDGTFRYLTPSAADVFGYAPEELVGEVGFDYIHPEDRPVAMREFAEMIETTGYEPEIEFRFEHKDGSWIVIEALARDLRDDPDIEGIVIYTRDVTALKERERALEKSEQRYRTVVENFPNGVVVLFDEDLRYLTVGGDVYDGLDVSVEDLEGERITEMLPDGLLEAIEPKYRAVFDGEATEFEHEFDGQIRRFQVHPVCDESGTVFAGMAMSQDITEQRERERALEESNERLQQFAYAASHDLQEPLRMVSSYLQLLENRCKDDLDQDAKEFIEFALDGADRMREMIEGLLEYSRIETRGNPFEPVDLNEVLEAVRGDLRVRIEETDATITADDLPRVEGDPGQLRQVFQNLLTNAIEYRGDDPPRIDITAERDGEDWTISVRDEGIGIDPDETERIFAVFQRLHTQEEHSGTGIGLSLCQRIVERHGGTIGVDSAPGEGSTFSVRLPALE